MASRPGLYRDGDTFRVRRFGPDPPFGGAARLGFVPVTVSLYAGLGRYAPRPGSLALQVEEGLTLGELLEALGVPAGEAKLVFVNYRAAGQSHILRSGDRIGAFPLIAGG